MKAIDVHAHLKSVGVWVDWEGGTCDGFKAGSPDTELTGIAVGWISTRDALEQARGLGCNLFITHEPTYYNHMDNDESVFHHDHARRKRTFLEESGMVVYRCHDVWDCMPEIGIPDAWARGLGLEGPPLRKGGAPSAPRSGRHDQFYAVYRVRRQPVETLARSLAKRVEAIGQDGVYLIGDGRTEVESVAIGTGAITNAWYMAADLGADAILVTDDGCATWRDGAWCLDRGTPMLMVNHATAEEWGMDTMAAYLQKRFPDIPVHRVRQGCIYRTIRP